MVSSTNTLHWMWSLAIHRQFSVLLDLLQYTSAQSIHLLLDLGLLWVTCVTLWHHQLGHSFGVLLPGILSILSSPSQSLGHIELYNDRLTYDGLIESISEIIWQKLNDLSIETYFWWHILAPLKRGNLLTKVVVSKLGRSKWSYF